MILFTNKYIRFSFILFSLVFFTNQIHTFHEKENDLAAPLGPNVAGSFFVGSRETAAAVSSSAATNISTIVGKTVFLNCSLVRDAQFGANDFIEKLNSKPYYYSRLKQTHSNSELHSTTTRNEIRDFKQLSQLTFYPTWLKADAFHNEYGFIDGYRTENILVTRKGIIADAYRDRVKLVAVSEKLQILEINDVDIKDEGKYICREFNSKIDWTFYLNVFCKPFLN